MFRREIQTSYDYAQNSLLLWKILIDFPNYPDWNQFILNVDGEAVEGSRIKFKFQLPRGVILPATANILKLDAGNEIRWKGRLLIPGLFSAEHYYCFSTGVETCTLSHGEIFRGFLVPLIWPLLRKKGTPVYKQHNIDLDNRAKKLTNTE